MTTQALITPKTVETVVKAAVQTVTTSTQAAKNAHWVNGKSTNEIPEGAVQVPRFPKCRVAILMGYNGKNYHGLQWSKDFPTIEGELFKALVQGGYILAQNQTDPKKSNLNRAGRTDKGVHAARQVVSLKIMWPEGRSTVQVVEGLNESLPAGIRVWGKTYTFRPPHSSTYYHPDKDMIQETGTPDEPLSFEPLDLPKADPAEYCHYRATPDQIKTFRWVIEAYQGTHIFHNFTIGKKYTEASAQRFIKSAECSEPFLGPHGREWIRVKFHGQSFMLHQIRKMISFAILAVRTKCPVEKILPQLFTNITVNLPKAPGLGLFMDEPIFGIYNLDENEKQPSDAVESVESVETTEEGTLKRKRPKKEYKNVNKRIESGKDKIEFDKHVDKINAFKEDVIYKTIFDEEAANEVFEGWTLSTDRHSFYFMNYLNKQGIVREIFVKNTPIEPQSPASQEEE